VLAGISGVHIPGMPLGPIGVIGLYFALLGTLVSHKWQRLREGAEPRWAGFWQNRVGRALVRVAGIRLGKRAIPADRPTELGIALSAEALYSGLSKEVRRSLGDVPAVLHDLETHARSMRARMEELDESLIDAQRSPTHSDTSALQGKLVADLRAARAHAEKRLSDVVTALETLRLDLLRLHAGAGGAESVTQDLAAAVALGEEVDRLVAGGREVEQALRLPRQTW
jgi:eukaryotic-like serine/threonine-protein kinase